MLRKLIFITILTALLPLGAVFAGETAISQKPIIKNGMIIFAAYLGPEHTAMAPMLPGMARAADIHLETDLYASKHNKQGLEPGTWIPYLAITYHLSKQGSDWATAGPSVPMVASDGLHYGNNVKLDGPGKYTLTLHIEPPPYAGFSRHTDKEIGVAPWWEPFSVSWTFDWPGNGESSHR
ncbi:MAG TPA: iron transporter [Gammaproteobacteria bacterium]|nr:iron transporter [Gammaproteobacteria bacterium]